MCALQKTASAKLHEYIQETYGNRYKQHVYYPKDLMGTRTISPYQYAYCACIFGILEWDVTIEEVQRFQKEIGVRVWAGTYAENETAIDIAIEMGAELITCNNPDEVLSILRRKGLHE